MSCDKEHSIGNTGNFELVCMSKFEGTIPFSMYRSVNTGITVCIAEVDGPLIYGNFNIVTETLDNDGLPCALALLIFAGSEECPYNKTLNSWIFRGLGSEINASILRDRTVFTMNAAGSKAFLSLMPLYLDHILYPSLKDSAYLISIHHITDKGNAGDLYCTLQKGEHSPTYIIKKEIFRALYPENCGYKSNIPGTTKNLRKSTTNKKVKQFHKKFYKSENLTVLITGKIQHDKIFHALLPLEKKIMLTKRKDIFKRPWRTPIEHLRESVNVDVDLPVSDESNGEVHVAWRGPSTVTQIYDCRGCVLLLQYLTQTSSPLTKYFVVQNKISSSIQYHLLRLSDSVFYIILKEVPIEKIDLITTTSVHKILSDIYIDGINMEMMRNIIHEVILHCQLALEENPHEKIASVVFNHIVYGNTNDLDQRLNIIRDLEKLKNETEEYFLSLLKTYFVDAPMVAGKGKPSRDEYLKFQKEEKHLAEQITKLNRNCLEQKEHEFHEALREHKKPVPYEVLAKVPIPGTDSITFYDIERRYNTETLEQHPKLDVTKLPFFTYLDHVNTNFIYLQFIMDTSSISTHDKLYIPLLKEIITNSPVKSGVQLIASEEIKDLKEYFDSIKFYVCTALTTAENHSYCMSLMFQVELQNYENGVQWCKEVLYDSKLTVKRLKIAITQLLHKLKNQMFVKQLVKTLLDIVLYKKDSNQWTWNILRQLKFLFYVKDQYMNTYEGQKYVIAKLESVRKILTLPRNMFLHMALNVEKLTEQVSNVYAPWKKYFSNFVTLKKPKPNITADWQLLKSFDRMIYNGFILGSEQINSTCFIQTCPYKNDVRNFDFAALCVCLKYFTQIGGPMWQKFEDKSIAYNLYFSADDNLLCMALYFCTDLLTAYEDLKLIIETHGTEYKWDQYLYESAKSIAIVDFISKVRTIKRMVQLSWQCYCRNVPYDDYIRQTVRHMSAVTVADLSRVTHLYVKPLFDPKKCKTAIVCNISKITEIEDAFHRMNFSLKVYKSLEHLSKYVEKAINRQSDQYSFY